MDIVQVSSYSSGLIIQLHVYQKCRKGRCRFHKVELEKASGTENNINQAPEKIHTKLLAKVGSRKVLAFGNGKVLIDEAANKNIHSLIDDNLARLCPRNGDLAVVATIEHKGGFRDGNRFSGHYDRLVQIGVELLCRYERRRHLCVVLHSHFPVNRKVVHGVRDGWAATP